jgi:hypothetical protein
MTQQLNGTNLQLFSNKDNVDIGLVSRKIVSDWENLKYYLNVSGLSSKLLASTALLKKSLNADSINVYSGGRKLEHQKLIKIY